MTTYSGLSRPFQNPSFRWVFLFFLVTTAGILAGPIVSNVTLELRQGTQLLDITYDLAHPEGLTCTITVEATTGADKWVLLREVTGEGSVGEEVTVGTGKSILWDIGSEWDNQLLPNLKVRVRADDGQGSAFVQIFRISPSDQAEMVNVARETIVYFDDPVDPSTVTTDSFSLIANGEALAGRVVVSSTERFATFFYDEPLPSSTEVRVIIDGGTIIGRNGIRIDADGDGIEGGVATADFRTLPLTRIAGTNVFGHVYDSLSGLPIVGATIRVDAFAEANAVTDAAGRFELKNMPAPEFFVRVDGSTATNSAPGFVYPNVGKPFFSVPGQSVHLNHKGVDFDIFLPPMALADIQSLSSSADTDVGFGSAGKSTLATLLPELDPTVWDRMSVTFPPGSARDDLATPATTAAIRPGPTNRLPAPLPATLNPAFVISIQTPGATNFDVPAPVTFPNTDGLLPGEKSLIWSFNHDAGEWYVIGTGTVSEDGLLLVSDPGVGILAPGWHFAWPGTQGRGGAGKPSRGMPGDKDEEDCDKLMKLAMIDEAGCLVGAGTALLDLVPVVGCGIGLASGLTSYIAKSEVEGSYSYKEFLINNFKSGLGCIPIVGEFITLDDCFNATQSLKKAVDCERARGRPDPGFGPDHTQRNADFENMRDVFNDVLAEEMGDPAWKQTTPVGQEMVRDILEKIASATSESSESGDLIVQSERDEIDALPKPSNFDPDEVDKAIDRLNGFRNGELTPEAFGMPALKQAAENMLSVYGEIHGRYVTTVYVGPDGLGRFQNEKVEGRNGPLIETTVFYNIVDLETGFEIRGELLAGRFDNFVFAPNRYYSISYLDPVTLTTGITLLQAPPSGDSFDIPKAFFSEDDVDTDGDGLSDEAEKIIGTSITDSDTDDDGIDDFTEFTTDGLNPLDDRGFPTGIIASLPLNGEATEVIVEVLPGTGLTAFLATGSNGLAIVDVNEFSNPIVLGQLSLAGYNTDVAYDRVLNIAAVAGDRGLHLVDVSDPMLPQERESISGGAVQVEAADGIAYVINGGSLFSYDLLTGVQYAEVPVSSSSLTGLALDRDVLYAMDSEAVLYALQISNIQINLLTRLQLPGGGGKISVGDGIVYVGASPFFGRGGYLTVDVADPANMALVSGSSVVAPFLNIGDYLVDNGSGTGLLIGSSGVHALDLMETSDSGNTGSFLTRIVLPARPQSVTIAAGIAFVADGTAGLQTVNYLGFDTSGIAPSVSMSDLTFLDVDPESAGIQILEGSNIPIDVTVTDDVQVSSVQLLVDGVVVASDASYPWKLRATMPSILSGISQLTLQIQAVDTGGNVGLASEVIVQVFPDTVPPTLDFAVPEENGEYGQNLTTLYFAFSEPMAIDTLIGDNFQLVQLDNPGTPIVAETRVVRLSDTVVLFNYPNLDTGAHRVTIKSSRISDFSENRLGAQDQIIPFRILGASAVFDNPLGGDWHNADNWKNGRVPLVDDTVFLDVEGGAVITFSESTASLNFSKGNISGLPAFVTKIIQSDDPDSPDPVSAYLKASLPDLVRGQLELFDEFGGDPNPIEFHLVDLLNDMVRDSAFYDAGRFVGIVLRAETAQLIGENPTGSARNRLNRMLLEDAYTEFLPKNPIAGRAQIKSLTGTAILELKSGRLEVNGPIRLDGQIRMNGGILANAVVETRLFDGINAESDVDILVMSLFGGVFDGVTIEGIVEVQASRQISIENGITVNGEIRMVGSGNRLIFVGDETISGTGSILFQWTSGGRFPALKLGDEGGTLTIGSGITLEGGSALLGGSDLVGNPVNIVNQGLIRSVVAGQTITIQTEYGGSFQNQGTLEALNGGLFSINNLVGGLGTVNTDEGSRLDLAGEFTLAEYQSMINKRLPIDMGGVIDFEGGTLVLNDATGEVSIGGATLKNGTIAISGSGNLNPTDRSTLENVTIEGELSMNTRGGSFEFGSGITLNGTIVMQARDTRLLFSGETSLLNGTGTVKLMSNDNTISLPKDGTLTIGSGITLEGGYTEFRGWNARLVNQGTVRSNVGNGKIIVGAITGSGGLDNPTTFENQGTLEMLDGGTLQIQNLVGNLGNISIEGASELILDGTAYVIDQDLTIPAGASLALNGGWVVGAQITNEGLFSFGGELTLSQIGNTVSGTGQIALSGILDLEGGTLNIDDNFGELLLKGGTIKNGTIAFGGSGSLVPSSFSSSFENLVLEGDTVIAGGGLRIRNGLTVNGTIGLPSLFIFGDETFDGTGTILFQSPNNFDFLSIGARAAAILTIGSDLTLEGAMVFKGSVSWEMSLVNLGTIRANSPTKKLAIGETQLGRLNYVTLENQGTLEAVNGGVLEVVELSGNLGMVNIQGASSLILNGAAYVVDTALTIPDTGRLTLLGGWDAQVQIANAGTLDIGGELTLTELGSLVSGTGAVVLSGVLDLEEGTMNIDDAFGELILDNGTIKNGTIALGGSGALTPLGQSGQLNVLENIVLDGSLTISAGRLALSGSLTVNGKLTLENSSYLSLVAEVAIDGAGSMSLSISSVSGTASNPPFQLTIGPNITLDGDGLTFRSSISLLNMGAIRSTESGAGVLFSGAFENQGTVEVLAGAVFEVRNLTGNGVGNTTLGVGSQLVVSGDLTQSQFGNIVNNDGNVKLRGVLDLENGTLNLDDAFGELLMNSGTIKNGTIAISGTGNLNPSGGTLENVIIEGEMRMKEFSGFLLIRDDLTLNGTIRLQAPGIQIGFDGDEAINGTGKIVFETTVNDRTSLQMVSFPGELTIGSGITLEGGRVTLGVRSPYAGWGRVMDLVNLGTIRANVAGQTITFDPGFGTFDNQGTLEELDGGIIVLP